MKADELIERLRDWDNVVELSEDADNAAAMLERFLALADELVHDARERERECPRSLTEKDIAYGMRLAAKRIREELEGRES